MPDITTKQFRSWLMLLIAIFTLGNFIVSYVGKPFVYITRLEAAEKDITVLNSAIYDIQSDIKELLRRN